MVPPSFILLRVRSSLTDSLKLRVVMFALGMERKSVLAVCLKSLVFL